MKILLLKVSFICLLLAGCQATHLVYVHGTTMGLDVAASTEGTGRLVFGYDRDTFALIPRKKDNEDAMSLAAVSCIYAKGLDDVQFNHLVSTGDAATSIMQTDKEDLKAFVKQVKSNIQGGGDECAPTVNNEKNAETRTN
jgi:hypothetical protein